MSTIIGKELLPEGEELDDILSIIKEHGIENYEMKIEKGAEAGSNFLGVILFINVEEVSANNGKVLNLVLKYSQRSESKETLVDMNDIYKREISSYKKYLPELFDLQKKHDIINGLSPVAKVYRCSSANAYEYLIMENMKMHGFKMMNKKIPMDFNHCKLVITQLGYLHGLGYVWKTKESEEYQKLVKKYKNNVYENLGNKNFKEFFNSIIQTTSKLFDPETESVAYNKVMGLYDFGLEHYVIKSNGSHLIDKYSVIVHGDCWPNNLLFKYDAENNPIQVCLIDWQLSRIVSPAIELSYFIYLASDTETRKNHFDELIDIYYNALCSVIKKCDLNPDELLPFTVLQKHMKKYFSFGIQFACQIISMLMFDGEEIEGYEILEELFDKNSPYINMGHNQQFAQRLRGVILHGIERQFI